MTTPAQRKALEKVKATLETFTNAQNYFEVLTKQYSYVHPQLVVTHDPIKGRGIKASKDIPAGTVLISNPSGLRVDLSDGMDHRQGNVMLGLSMFEQLSKYGFALNALGVPNDTLGLATDFEQTDFDIGTRGANALQEYPLTEVFPVQPEFLCPNLSKTAEYPNPLLFIDEKGTTQHVKLGINPNLPAELRTNLINAMQDQKVGYPTLIRTMLMAQENSILTPYNIPFLLPNMFIKFKPLSEADSKKLKAKNNAKADNKVAKKSTPKVIAGRKGGTLTIPAKAAPAPSEVKEEKKQDADEDEVEPPLAYNFFEQLAEDNGNIENIPANLLRSCPQLIVGEDDEEEEDEDDEEEEETASSKFKAKQQQRGKNEEEDAPMMESRDSLAIFPTFALLNHDCQPNTSPLFFHIPTDEYLGKLYKEHKEALAASEDGQPASFNLPRNASLAACAIVVALNDIKAGDELTINYTPLAHCETSPHLTRAGAPVIQYIPWMQEFRQSQMKRVHHMLCKCSTCETDIVLQKVVGTQNAIVARHELEEEKKKAEEKKDLAVDKEKLDNDRLALEKILDEQKPLEAFTKIDPTLRDEFYSRDPKTVAQRLLLHTVVLSDQTSKFNRDMLPMFLYIDRYNGTAKSADERGVPKSPDDILARLHTLVKHPLWKSMFATRGGWDKVDSSTPFLKLSEIFATSQALVTELANALKAGRADESKSIPKDAAVDESLQNADLIPIIVPSGFVPANTTKTDGVAPVAIVPTTNSTLVPTIASLDVTTSLSTSIGIYAAVSAGYERMQVYGLPDLDQETEEEKAEKAEKEKEAAASTNTPETDLLIDGEAAPAGTAAEKEEKQRKQKTHALVNASTGEVIEPDDELLRLFRESETYREMVTMLEAVLAEVLGLTPSEGRKEYLSPTHWFVPTCLGILHPLYMKLGAHAEAMIASLFLALITGLSVPLSDVQAVDAVKINPRTPKDMREAKKINKYFSFQQAMNPVPGTTIKPLHPTLVSLFVYLSDSLEQLLRDCEIAIQYSKFKLAELAAEAEQTDEVKAQIEKFTQEFEFSSNVNSAIWFLGQSIEGYTF